ncbi:cardiolipin synthase B [Noviherbaspirillum cavernae]|uniref:Cardiolipin synthase B n=1 Tax=Noviherbaspirillum cavernae TaxID=2320862 RepID=A0A418WX04_9BURK|nr:phospholipase D-like domain-containing protein [Noviherbaspirillum cavernae]RJG04717.1 cardiolipin synthase B [Noviherbaspirillum cavernae]
MRYPLRLLCTKRNASALLFLFSLMAGCAALPDVSYLRNASLAQPQQLRIITTRGELSDARKQSLLQDMAAQAGATDILDRHVAAEEAISGTPLVAGNKVTLLDDGPLTIRAMRDAIGRARDHINLETYIIEDDEVGRALSDLLIKKRAAGVQVNLIHDGVGTLGTPREFFDRLRAGGIAVLEFNPVDPSKAKGKWDINQRDHRKLLVVDGRVAFTGGVNISGVYGKSALLSRRPPPTVPSAPPDAGDAAWRDTHMRIEGPAVAEFQKMFLETWQRKSGHALSGAQYFPPLKAEGKALVRALGSVAEKADYTIYKTYVSAFANADKSVYLTTAYFVPDRQIVDAMKDAARRGVEVKLIFPSFTDHALILYASRSYYDELLEAGIRVYERNTALLHAKTAVIDGVWSTIGSTNLDMRSFLHNDELNAVVLSADFAERMEALFERDLRESTEITALQWKQRGWLDRLREWGARLFSYWL